MASRPPVLPLLHVFRFRSGFILLFNYSTFVMGDESLDRPDLDQHWCLGSP
jgi:hypothetical protein